MRPNFKEVLMTKLYTLYGTAVTLAFAFATYQGYAFSSLFDTQQHGSKGSSSSRSYHK
jgi:hypothetical protein